MTRSPRGREPGRLLLALARLLFDDATRASIVHPAIADFQQEWREAGPNRRRRYGARCHGLWAFCKLVAIVPFNGMRAGVRRDALSASDEFDGPTLAILALAFFASAWGWPFFGWFTALAMGGGLVTAAAIRWWHTRRQPLADADPFPRCPARVQMEPPSSPVGREAGVLICLVGSVAVLVQGMPGFVWFLLGAVGVGVLLAGALWIWRTRCPASGT